MKGVVSGTDTDSDRHDRYLVHFFKDVDKGVTAHLRRDTRPLLLAGVEPTLRFTGVSTAIAGRSRMRSTARPTG
jgi:hypothetical protein